MSDILILLISYRHTTDFLNLARNTGFILSAVIVRVAISTSGYSGVTLFILAAILAASVLQISLTLGKEFKPIIGSQTSEESNLFLDIYTGIYLIRISKRHARIFAGTFDGKMCPCK